MHNPWLIDYNQPVDIVNEHDQVLYSMLRADAILQNILYRRTIRIFLKNKEGKYCFLKRAEHLSYLPGHYALVGGGVLAGETYATAAVRHVQEEVGITIPSCTEIAVLSPLKFGGQHFKAVYEIILDDEQIRCNPCDFSSYIWLTPHEYHIQVRDGKPDLVVPDLDFLMKKFVDCDAEFFLS